ncbi:MAG: ammonium transporter [Candidatus Nanopelagicales bacterium]|nr:ammonium transporter [Candidatus Nanopelagicales bacterium]MCF8541866.1 ammonium transporter [Candidatus Nanopelagicales bacterium]MCF8556342.1 ammonium transporter [Candidatus Nanopelagicales bacterium]
MLDTGNTAWVLTAAAMVLLMIPGLAFFYGGMVRSKSVLNMLMMVMGAAFVVMILWVLFGYSMAFGTDQNGLIGNPTEFFGLEGLMADDPEASLPAMAFVSFQAMFAALTVGLIAGAIADRAKFGAWLVFGGIWAIIVYFPVAHWVWSAGGWIFELGVIDFAGGTAVHINAGAAALALAIVIGRRVGWPKTPMRPHNLTLVMIGAGLLWFGWFGFNAGSALAADNSASVVFLNTFVATAAAGLAWLAVEKIRDGHATSLGAASGIVAGLVAITPACSSVSPIGAIVIGIVAGVLCALAVGLKYKLGYDDSLDVVGVHLVGGLVGTLLIGVLATEAAPAGVNGLLYGGGADQLGKQAIGAFAVLFYSLIVAAIIALIIKAARGFRVDEDVEVSGIDLAVHAESGYELGDSGGGGAFAGVGHAARNKEVQA